ncbi:MAG: RadC family protein [Oscillospiraceae bacterium]|nr:RadC family protein [Oscillospiraceae bacterium]
MSIHDGHRQRLKNRFMEEGLDNFEEVNVLEILLFYCIPRKDTNPIAHALLSQFGSLVNVLEATVEELVKVEGITENAAVFLKLSTAVNKYYMVKKVAADTILDTTEKYGRYLVPKFQGKRNETVYLLCLDAKCKVICCREISEGSVNSAGVSIRKILEVALAANATTVILAHNHPSGLALPSGEDVATTKRVAEVLGKVEVQLFDHIIVSDDDFVSLTQSGFYDPGAVFAKI